MGKALSSPNKDLDELVTFVAWSSAAILVVIAAVRLAEQWPTVYPQWAAAFGG